MKHSRPCARQSGISLLESLLAILIFSVGILALVALQSISVKATTESKHRADAGFLASQLIARMWTDPVVTQTNPVSLASYAHNAGGGNCAFSGGPSANPNVTAWAASVLEALPGSSAASTQVLVGANNLVTVNICWQPPGADSTRQFSTVTQVNM